MFNIFRFLRDTAQPASVNTRSECTRGMCLFWLHDTSPTKTHHPIILHSDNFPRRFSPIHWWCGAKRKVECVGAGGGQKIMAAFRKDLVEISLLPLSHSADCRRRIVDRSVFTFYDALSFRQKTTDRSDRVRGYIRRKFSVCSSCVYTATSVVQQCY